MVHKGYVQIHPLKDTARTFILENGQHDLKDGVFEHNRVFSVRLTCGYQVTLRSYTAPKKLLDGASRSLVVVGVSDIDIYPSRYGRVDRLGSF